MSEADRQSNTGAKMSFQEYPFGLAGTTEGTALICRMQAWLGKDFTGVQQDFLIKFRALLFEANFAAGALAVAMLESSEDSVLQISVPNHALVKEVETWISHVTGNSKLVASMGVDPATGVDRFSSFREKITEESLEGNESILRMLDLAIGCLWSTILWSKSGNRAHSELLLPPLRSLLAFRERFLIHHYYATMYEKKSEAVLDLRVLIHTHS